MTPPDGWHWQQVVTYAFRVVSRTLDDPEHNQEAAWIANEAAYLAVKRYEGRGGCPWRAYLRKIARFRALRYLERARRRGVSVRSRGYGKAPVEIIAIPVREDDKVYEPDHLGGVYRDELLAMLDPATRIIVMCIEEGGTQAEAARLAGYANQSSAFHRVAMVRQMLTEAAA